MVNFCQKSDTRQKQLEQELNQFIFGMTFLLVNTKTQPAK